MENHKIHKLKQMLPSIHSEESYEQFKSNTEILREFVNEIIVRYQLPQEPLILLEGTNIVFAHGNTRIIKIFPPFHKEHFTHEVLVMHQLYHKLSVNTPKIEYEGEVEGWPFIVMSRLEGTLLEVLWEKIDHANKIMLIQELGSLIREVHSVATQGLEAIDCHWEAFIHKQKLQCLERHRTKQLSEKLVQQIPKYLESSDLPKIIRPVILTGEYTPMNLLVREISGVWHICGLIDFGDAMLGLPEYDLLGPGAFLIQGDKQLLKEFLQAYGYSKESMTPALSRQLTILLLLHRYSNLNVQIRIKDWKSRVNRLEDLENLVWGF